MSPNRGGVETYIVNLAKHLGKAYELYFPMPDKQMDACCAPTQNCKFISVNIPHRKFLAYLMQWKKIMQREKFDVIYFNTCDVVCIDILKIAKWMGIPVRIIHAHSTGNQQSIQQCSSLYHRLSEKLSRATLHKYVTHFFACSQSAGDWMFDGRPYRIIQNGIEIEKYHFSSVNRKKCRDQLGLTCEEAVGFIGRLSAAKNPFFAVEIASYLIQQEPTAKLVMIGDGELADEVRAHVQRAGLENHVFLTGAVDNVYQWMSAIDCLIMPSLFEGLPFVLVEAQAAGLPAIVSTNVSEEANISGLVQYLPLEQGAEAWAKEALSACDQSRKDVDQELIHAGYSIQETANTVSSIIGAALS